MLAPYVMWKLRNNPSADSQGIGWMNNDSPIYMQIYVL